MTTSRKTIKDIPKEVHELQIATALAGVNMNFMVCELVLEVQKGMKKHGGKFSISHAIEIKLMVEKRYNPEKKTKKKSNEKK